MRCISNKSGQIIFNELIYEKHRGGLPNGWRRETSKECHATDAALIYAGVFMPLLLCGLLVL